MWLLLPMFSTCHPPSPGSVIYAVRSCKDKCYLTGLKVWLPKERMNVCCNIHYVIPMDFYVDTVNRHILETLFITVWVIKDNETLYVSIFNVQTCNSPLPNHVHCGIHSNLPSLNFIRTELQILELQYLNCSVFPEKIFIFLSYYRSLSKVTLQLQSWKNRIH